MIIGCIASHPKLLTLQNTAGLLTYDKAFLRGTHLLKRLLNGICAPLVKYSNGGCSGF